MNNDNGEHLAFSIAQFSARAGISRSATYRELKVGRLTARKVGRRSIITADEAKRWLAALPEAANDNDPQAE